MNILITGGAGFIGTNFVKYCLNNGIKDIHVLDKFTYASHPEELERSGVPYTKIDLVDSRSLADLFQEHKFTHIIHFAAESHVDNSIKDPLPFIDSNITGTVNLLQQAVEHKVKKFLHISTDEVFGEISWPVRFNENSRIAPKNPYSASKAAAEHFVVAYGNTYKLPYTIVNCSNNYGPWQNREKLIPTIIGNALAGKNIPVYGNGQQVRDWIYVGDACAAIARVFKDGRNRSRYCIGGDSEIKNIDIVHAILDKLGASRDLVQYVKDRPGHDVRYATDITKINKELGWYPKVNLDAGLEQTIEWYKNK